MEETGRAVLGRPEVGADGGEGAEGGLWQVKSGNGEVVGRCDSEHTALG